MQIGATTPVTVTGGASGLGLATAEAMVALGAPVALFDRDVTRGQEAAAQIGALFVEVDVTDAASLAAGFDTAAAAHGIARLHVNCAGIAPAAKTVSRGAAHDAGLFAQVVAVNLTGSFLAGSQAAARMAQADPITADGTRGVVVHTASVAAFEGQIGQAAYAASKGGVASLTLPMARDLADKGVRVCAIAPGLFLTPMLEGLPEEVQASLGGQVPFPSRLGSPAEYAALVRHIAENEMLNGSVLRLDGAIRMGPR